jgi:hypothetical protein
MTVPVIQRVQPEESALDFSKKQILRCAQDDKAALRMTRLRSG